jgi:hypothetical protein
MDKKWFSSAKNFKRMQNVAKSIKKKASQNILGPSIPDFPELLGSSRKKSQQL